MAQQLKQIEASRAKQHEKIAQSTKRPAIMARQNRFQGRKRPGLIAVNTTGFKGHSNMKLQSSAETDFKRPNAEWYNIIAHQKIKPPLVQQSGMILEAKHDGVPAPRAQQTQELYQV